MILTKRLGLNFGNEQQVLLRSFLPRDKDPDYYHQTRRGLGYVSTPFLSNSRSDEEVYHDSLSATSSWDSDVSVGVIFKSLSVNIVSASHLEDNREDTFKSEKLI